MINVLGTEIGRRARLTKEQFIKKARKVHGNMYNYSKTNYINNRTKVVITCPIHGDFEQRPDIHLNGHGCLECGGNKKSTTEEFIKKLERSMVTSITIIKLIISIVILK